MGSEAEQMVDRVYRFSVLSQAFEGQVGMISGGTQDEIGK